MGTILVKSALNALKLKFSEKKNFIEEYHFRGMFFVVDIF